MAMGMKRTPFTSGVPIWQGTGKDIQLAQGGFKLAATGLVADSVIPAGTPIIFDEAARTATIVGGGNLQAIATGSPTTYRLNKGSTVKAGDYIALTAGGAAYAITGIDITNAAYDAVTTGTSIGNAAVGAPVFVSSATGASAAAYGAINGLLYDDTLANSDESVSVVIRGTVYARRLPFYTSALAALAGLDDIIFSQSK